MTDPTSIFTPEVSAEEKRRAAYRAWRAKNIESVRAKERAYAAANREKKNAASRAWIDARPEKAKEYGKRYRQAHKTKNAARCKAWAQNNLEKSRAKSNRWKIKNRERLRAYDKRWRSDPSIKITNSIRHRLSAMLAKQNAATEKHSKKYIGCNIGFLRGWLESKFLKGMTWDNYGEWHIDHIIPCSSFDHTDINQLLACWHYSNLRPLWAFDNRFKGGKIITSQPELPIPLFTHGPN